VALYFFSKYFFFRQVLQIVQMQLVSQENVLIGEPEPCQFMSSQIVPSVMVNNASHNMLVSSTSQEPVAEAEHIRIFQEPVHQTNRIPIIELSPTFFRQ
jgi:hypothetical protein